MNGKTWRALALFLCFVAVLGAAASSYGRGGGVPTSTTGAPGSTYGMPVSIAQTGMQRSGLEATDILASGAAGGTLTVTDAVNTQLITANVGGNLREYVTHAVAGACTGAMDGAVSWGFDRTAPLAGSGKVTFYAAGVAATDANGTDALPSATKAGPLVRALNTAPIISLTSPHAGERYIQREKRLITWTMSDAESPSSQLTVYLNYTHSGGSREIAGPLVGYTEYFWIVPADLTADDLVIHATVIDPEGLTSTTESPMIEIHPPTPGSEPPFFIRFWPLLIFMIVIPSLFLIWLQLGRKKRGDEEEAVESVVSEAKKPRMRKLNAPSDEEDRLPPAPPPD